LQGPQEAAFTTLLHPQLMKTGSACSVIGTDSSSFFRSFFLSFFFVPSSLGVLQSSKFCRVQSSWFYEDFKCLKLRKIMRPDVRVFVCQDWDEFLLSSKLMVYEDFKC
jgi:hypothetical protein